MDRARVLVRWAKIIGVDPSELSVPEDMRKILHEENELCRSDMKRWVLRAEDIPDAKWWMPHLIVEGAAVKVYYVWVKKEPPAPEYTIVLVVGGGLAQIHKWRDGELVESTPAKVGTKVGTGPTPAESLQIANYLSTFSSRAGGMTIDGKMIKKIE